MKKRSFEETKENPFYHTGVYDALEENSPVTLWRLRQVNSELKSMNKTKFKVVEKHDVFNNVHSYMTERYVGKVLHGPTTVLKVENGLLVMGLIEINVEGDTYVSYKLDNFIPTWGHEGQWKKKTSNKKEWIYREDIPWIRAQYPPLTELEAKYLN